jgi:transcriptional regulator with XRE-family HTH domain
MEQNVPSVKNIMFVEHFVRISDTYEMKKPVNKPDAKAAERKPKAPTPVWAQRLELALRQAGFVDQKGKIDKKRIGERYFVGPKAVEHWLNGAREPRYAVLVDLRRLTGLSLDWLFGAEDAAPFNKEPKAPLKFGGPLCSLTSYENAPASIVAS